MTARRDFGSIIDRGDSYLARYRLNGSQHSKTLPHTRAGKAEARAWLNQQQDSLRRDQRPGGVSFRRYANGYKPHYRAKLRPSTWRSVEHHIDAAVEFFGSRPIAGLKYADARAFLAHIKEARKVGAATLHRYAASLSAVFREAVRDDRIGANPFALVAIAKQDSPGRDWPTWGEVEVAIAATPDNIRPFVRFVAETGLRLSEAAGLTWGDVQDGRAVVRSHRAKSHRERRVPLTDAAQDVLHHMAPLEAEAAIRVFPYSADFYGRRFSQAMRARGFKITMHTLRHCAASRIVNSGIPIDVAQDWLGHSDPRVTRIYTHRRESALDEAARVLSDLAKHG